MGMARRLKQILLGRFPRPYSLTTHHTGGEQARQHVLQIPFEEVPPVKPNLEERRIRYPLPDPCLGPASG